VGQGTLTRFGLSQLVPAPQALEEVVHLAPLYFDALASDGGCGPSTSSHLSGVAHAPPWENTRFSKAPRRGVMWIQVVPTLKPYLVRWERGVIKE